MRLERGLRSAVLRPYALGYAAAPTDNVNRETPQCHFGGIKDSGVWLGEQDLPSVIEINVRVIPIWVENESAFATLDQFKACPIYPPFSVFSRVRVEATGTGHYQKVSGEEKVPFIGDRLLNYQLELPKPCLYQKEFLTQPQGRMVNWIVPESATEEILHLWAYGAQQIGEDIHPLVFTLESVRQNTCIRASSLLSWRERRILPITRGKVSAAIGVFQDVFEEDQTRTLMESIEAGMSVIYLNVGCDERGDSLKIPYRSYRFLKNLILYKKGE